MHSEFGEQRYQIDKVIESYLQNLTESKEELGFVSPLQVQVEVVRELLCHPGTDVRPQFQGRVTRFIKIHFFRDIGSAIFCQLMGFASPRSRIYNKQGLSPAECFDPRWP